MNTSISALLACSLLSCASINVVANDQGRTPTTNNGHLQTAGGNNSGGNHAGGGESGTAGGQSYGLTGERWQDCVPRTPMWLISTFTGQRNSPVEPAGNSRGIANWWRGDNAVDELLSRIEQGYDHGARWFFVNRPMGTPGFTHVPSASWLTIEDQKRDELPRKLTDALLDRFDEPVHVVWFIGSDMRDPREFVGWTENENDAEDFYGLGENDNWEELIATRVTLGGWISTGASGIGIDNSAPPREREHYATLFEQLYSSPFRLMLYGEAYPLKLQSNGGLEHDHAGRPIVDEEFSTRMPWVALERYVSMRWGVDQDSDNLSLDPDETRMFVWFSQSPMNYGNNDQRETLVNRYMDSGLIPITNDPVMFTESLNRLGTGVSNESNYSRSNGDDNQAGTGNGSVIIRPASRTTRRTSQSTTSNQRTSVPEHELPERYRNKGTGIR